MTIETLSERPRPAAEPSAGRAAAPARRCPSAATRRASAPAADRLRGERAGLRRASSVAADRRAPRGDRPSAIDLLRATATFGGRAAMSPMRRRRCGAGGPERHGEDVRLAAHGQHDDQAAATRTSTQPLRYMASCSASRFSRRRTLRSRSSTCATPTLNGGIAFAPKRQGAKIEEEHGRSTREPCRACLNGLGRGQILPSCQTRHRYDHPRCARRPLRQPGDGGLVVAAGGSCSSASSGSPSCGRSGRSGWTCRRQAIDAYERVKTDIDLRSHPGRERQRATTSRRGSTSSVPWPGTSTSTRA